MIFSGASASGCRRAAALAFSTARTTRKCWPCACIREHLDAQRLPKALDGKKIWQQRFDDILAFERHLARNGTLILKFFLNVSREEQRKRFLDRIDEPAKRWKFSMGDVEERKLWDKYMDAYEDMIRHTSTPEAPWYVVPADHKWFTRLVVAGAMVDALDGLETRISQGHRRCVEGTARSEEGAAQGKALRPSPNEGDQPEARLPSISRLRTGSIADLSARCA